MTAERPWPASSQPRAGTWMSVTALACGAMALALCWMPLVNLLAVVLALAGTVIGVVALVLAARGLHRGRRRAAVGVSASALALVVSLVVDVVWVARLGDHGTVSTAAPPPRPATSVTAPADPSAAAPASSAAPAPSASRPAVPSAAALEGLPLGTSATVGDYTVTVTGVNTDAGAVVAEANPYNKDPQGRYVIADVSVVYNGTDEGIPWAHLRMAFQGTDARDYSTSTCSAVLPRPGFSQPDLRTGGASDYQVCFDLPAEAIAGGAVKAEFYLPAEPATWAVTG